MSSEVQPESKAGSAPIACKLAVPELCQLGEQARNPRAGFTVESSSDKQSLKLSMEMWKGRQSSQHSEVPQDTSVELELRAQEADRVARQMGEGLTNAVRPLVPAQGVFSLRTESSADSLVFTSSLKVTPAEGKEILARLYGSPLTAKVLAETAHRAERAAEVMSGDEVLRLQYGESVGSHIEIVKRVRRALLLRTAASMHPKLQCGDHSYPLTQAIGAKLYQELAEILGLAPDSPTKRVQRIFHFEFQRLYHMPPHEMSQLDRDRWVRLRLYVDLQAWESKRDDAFEIRVGRLVKCEPDAVVVDWFGIGSESYDPLRLPSSVIGAQPGSTVRAEYRHRQDGGIEWINIRISPELRSDDQVLDEEGDRLARYSADRAPRSEWAKVRR